MDGREFLTDMELLKLGEIISTRIFNLGQLRSEVGFSNKVPADESRLHLLIYGKVRLNEEDEKGRWGHWWMTAEQLQEQEKRCPPTRSRTRARPTANERTRCGQGTSRVLISV